uniref:2-(3-amino-3-carboxypropyl)histidine synthase subunit 2 n=1 Tax=Knipowitschia caucasica TaxID=637954 RepID=A0AAV2LAR3_KNICA
MAPHYNDRKRFMLKERVLFGQELCIKCFVWIMADPFSSNSEDLIQRVIEVPLNTAASGDKLGELYQISETCEFITKHDFKKIALQFPDNLLVDSVAVASEIEGNTKAKVYILGDTSYGSCCVDEVAAEHIGADCIVHYGSSCLSPSKRLPLMYVFEKRPIDVEQCAATFKELYPDLQSHIVLLFDVNYVHAIGNLRTALQVEYPNLIFSDLLKEAIHKAGKKCYMFAMGKLNVPKLANFLEIDIYVLVACPENSLIDSTEFYKPVVTPFEMEVACNPNREWTEEYVTDFRHLLPGGQSHVPLAELKDYAEADVSLISGALRRQCLDSESDLAPESSSVVLRNQTMSVASTNSAASFLSGRSWQGLEKKLGETPVVKAVEGRRGIAIAYEDEGSK